MNLVKLCGLLAIAASVSACDEGLGVKGDKTVDRGLDAKDLSQLKAGIWVDPNGCDHWIIDDGVEGYMDLKRDRQGLPTCHPVKACAVMNSDQLFATDKYAISSAGRARLTDFFNQAGATAYIIIGHTDSRASDEYNMRLSYNRANAVAKIAAGTGARIADVRGYGERMPKASNATAAGMQQNRRVEVICLR